MFRPTRLSSFALTLGTGALSAHLIVVVLFALTPLGGTLGLLAVYAETVAIAVGLAALRLQSRAPESANGWRFFAPSNRVSRVRPKELSARFDDVQPDNQSAA